MSEHVDREATKEADAHVWQVVRSMWAGRWKTGLSHVKAAEHWGKSQRYVEERVAEARRFIRLYTDVHKDELRAQAILELEGLTADIRRGKRPEGAVKAIELRLRLQRLIDEPKSQGPSGAAPFTTAAEMLAYFEAVLPELREQVAAEARAVQVPQLPEGE